MIPRWGKVKEVPSMWKLQWNMSFWLRNGLPTKPDDRRAKSKSI